MLSCMLRLHVKSILIVPASARELSTSSAWAIPLAKRAASSLLPKLSPHTCRASRHWWKLGVASLYFRPFTIGQLITTLERKGSESRHESWHSQHWHIMDKGKGTPSQLYNWMHSTQMCLLHLSQPLWIREVRGAVLNRHPRHIPLLYQETRWCSV